MKRKDLNTVGKKQVPIKVMFILSHIPTVSIIRTVLENNRQIESILCERQESFDMLEQMQPEVLIFEMINAKSFSPALEAKKLSPHTRCIGITTVYSEMQAFAARSTELNGYITATMSEEAIVETFDVVMSGRTFIPGNTFARGKDKIA